MLTMTEAAGAYLAQLLETAQAPEGVAVRVVVEKDEVSMQPGRPEPGEVTFDHAGRTVLVLDEQLSTALTDKTLDVEQTDEGPTLALR